MQRRAVRCQEPCCACERAAMTLRTRAMTRIPHSFGLSGTMTPQTRSFPFRSIRNAAVRLALYPFGLSGTLPTKPQAFCPSHAEIISSHRAVSRNIPIRPIGNIGWKPAQKPFGRSGTPHVQTAGRLFGLSRTVSAHREQSIGLSGTNHRSIRNASSAYQEQALPVTAD